MLLCVHSYSGWGKTHSDAIPYFICAWWIRSRLFRISSSIGNLLLFPVLVRSSTIHSLLIIFPFSSRVFLYLSDLLIVMYPVIHCSPVSGHPFFQAFRSFSPKLTVPPSLLNPLRHLCHPSPLIFRKAPIFSAPSYPVPLSFYLFLQSFPSLRKWMKHPSTWLFHFVPLSLQTSKPILLFSDCMQTNKARSPDSWLRLPRNQSIVFLSLSFSFMHAFRWNHLHQSVIVDLFNFCLTIIKL